MSFRPMVSTGGAFAGNGLRFATREEAEASARDLYQRWTLWVLYSADESDDPVNCAWDSARGNVHLEVINV
jgi:hypothetical protein